MEYNGLNPDQKGGLRARRAGEDAVHNVKKCESLKDLVESFAALGAVPA